jgi:hypothetical protein
VGNVYFEKKQGMLVSFSVACDKVLSAGSRYKRGRNTTCTVIRIFYFKIRLLFFNIIYHPCGFSVYCAGR